MTPDERLREIAKVMQVCADRWGDGQLRFTSMDLEELASSLQEYREWLEGEAAKWKRVRESGLFPIISQVRLHSFEDALRKFDEVVKTG